MLTSVYITFPFSYFTSVTVDSPIYIFISSTILLTEVPFWKKFISLLLFYTVIYSE
uniref:Uncharacterized protein n=1 Tax=Podoviridae sp. ct8Lf7 TaxID=2827723 RepID=A0A8S5S182_9CAUD|nr:MAG TPA: hypothetical protein [Podoviridae sp. ct8Lf7]